MKVFPWKKIRDWFAIRAFCTQRAAWYEDLARALGDGIALADYLKKSIQREQTYGSRQVAIVLRMILARLPSMALNEALSGILPETERMILAAAERAGALKLNLERLADSTHRVGRMQRTLRTALAGPLLPLAISGYILWYTSTTMIPRIAEILPAEKWTGAAVALRILSDVTVDYGLFIIGAILALAAFGMRQMPRWTGSRRRIADDWLFGLYRDYQGALFLTAFSALLRAGVGQREALQLMASRATPWLRWHCNTIANRMVRYSDTPGMAFDSGLLPRSITNRIMDLAERGTALPEVMEKIGGTILEDTEERLSVVAGRLGFVVEALAAALLLLISVGTTGIAGGASAMSGMH